jgi:peroxiredoxin
MTWIMFTDQDRTTTAPDFSLPAVGSGKASRRDYYQSDNLVLFFLHGVDHQGHPCVTCQAVLDDLANHWSGYRARDAKILVLIPEVEWILAKGIYLAQSVIPLLADEHGSIRSGYISLVDAELVQEGDCLLFVLDNYGVPYAACIAPELDQAGLHIEIMSWLDYIGVQCPE